MAGRGRLHHRLADRARLSDGAHLEVIRDDDAREPHFAPQVVADDAPREGRRYARRVEVRVDGVARHQALDAFLHGGEKGREMRCAHLGPGRVDRGQSKMGIERRMAFAREMLGARREAPLLHPLDARHPVASDHGRILTVRTDPDVRAITLGQDVEHGREVHVHSEPA